MKHLILTIFCFIFGGIIQVESAQSQDYDIVINNGRVIDAETKLDAVRHVGIKDAKIALISKEPLKGKTVIDATGLIVAPGFVDFHAYGQNIPADRMQAFDGVTTALELESGILPVAGWYDIQEKTGRVLNYGVSAAWTYARVAVHENLETNQNSSGFRTPSRSQMGEQCLYARSTRSRLWR